MNLDELAKQQEYAYQGYVLSDWYEAAIPSFELHLRVQLLAHKDLSPVQQFVIRALDSGLNDPDAVCGVLGIERAIFSRESEELERLGCLLVVPSAGSEVLLTLTNLGKRVAADLTIEVPVEEDYSVCIDAITGEYYPYRRLYSGKMVRDGEFHQIPVFIGAPDETSLKPNRLQRLWREHRRTLEQDRRNSELLDVVRIERVLPGYRTVRMLQFTRESDGDVKIQVYDHRDRLPEHEIALMRRENEGVHVLRVERLPRNAPSTLPNPVERLLPKETLASAREKAIATPELNSQIEHLEQRRQAARERKDTSGFEEQRREAATDEVAAEVEIERLRRRVEELESKAPNTTVLSMLEHRPRLLQMLRESKSRVIIISPWLSPVSVNRELRDAMQQALRRKVAIWIGFGFGPPDANEEETLKELAKLRKGEGGQGLHLQRLSDLHAKVLVCDDSYMISTSFNWLSFAGRPGWGNRIEYGLLTSESAAVAQMLAFLVPLFRDNGASVEETTSSKTGPMMPGEQRRQEILTRLRQPLTLQLDASVVLELLYIPAGEFVMGSNSSDPEAQSREKPQVRLPLTEFWIGRYPITHAQYAVYQNNSASPGHPIADPVTRGSHPVNGVSWDQAVAFCRWLRDSITGGTITFLEIDPQVVECVVRLPTEAEWEKAARGVDGRLYPWGDSFSPSKLNCNSNGTTPCGQFSPIGDSSYGCADMAGNVWEWTNSLFWRYPYRADDGREDSLSRENRVLRGGSYHNKRNRFRCANRVHDQPHKDSVDFGFRVALSFR